MLNAVITLNAGSAAATPCLVGCHGGFDSRQRGVLSATVAMMPSGGDQATCGRVALSDRLIVWVKVARSIDAQS
jgi:hypothetical protein